MCTLWRRHGTARHDMLDDEQRGGCMPARLLTPQRQVEADDGRI
jgi:hypothetical protein